MQEDIAHISLRNRHFGNLDRRRRRALVLGPAVDLGRVGMDRGRVQPSPRTVPEAEIGDRVLVVGLQAVQEAAAEVDLGDHAALRIQLERAAMDVERAGVGVAGRGSLVEELAAALIQPARDCRVVDDPAVEVVDVGDRRSLGDVNHAAGPDVEVRHLGRPQDVEQAGDHVDLRPDAQRAAGSAGRDGAGVGELAGAVDDQLRAGLALGRLEEQRLRSGGADLNLGRVAQLERHGFGADDPDRRTPRRTAAGVARWSSAPSPQLLL